MEDNGIIFIIGGGKSFEKVLNNKKLFDKLKDKNLFAVNNAYKIFPEANYFHFMDNYFWSINNDKMFNIWKGKTKPSTACRALRNNSSLRYYHKKANYGITLEKGSVCGNNSGHQSLNIAIQEGYSEIILCGFDMLPVVETHWHNDYTVKSNVSAYKSNFIPNFEKSVDIIKQLKVNVYNINKESALRCFKFANIEDFL